MLADDLVGAESLRFGKRVVSEAEEVCMMVQASPFHTQVIDPRGGVRALLGEDHVMGPSEIGSLPQSHASYDG